MATFCSLHQFEHLIHRSLRVTSKYVITKIAISITQLRYQINAQLCSCEVLMILTMATAKLLTTIAFKLNCILLNCTTLICKICIQGIRVIHLLGLRSALTELKNELIASENLLAMMDSALTQKTAQFINIELETPAITLLGFAHSLKNWDKLAIINMNEEGLELDGGMTLLVLKGSASLISKYQVEILITKFIISSAQENNLQMIQTYFVAHNIMIQLQEFDLMESLQQIKEKNEIRILTVQQVRLEFMLNENEDGTSTERSTEISCMQTKSGLMHTLSLKLTLMPLRTAEMLQQDGKDVDKTLCTMNGDEAI